MKQPAAGIKNLSVKSLAVNRLNVDILALISVTSASVNCSMVFVQRNVVENFLAIMTVKTPVENLAHLVKKNVKLDVHTRNASKSVANLVFPAESLALDNVLTVNAPKNATNFVTENLASILVL